MTPSVSEVRLAERLIAWIEANRASVAPEATIRPLIETFASTLAVRYGLPRLDGKRLGSLADATDEILARVADVGARPMELLPPEKFRRVAAEVPVTQDEVREHAAKMARKLLPLLDGEPIETVAERFFAGGILVGALIQSWRRTA